MSDTITRRGFIDGVARAVLVGTALPAFAQGASADRGFYPPVAAGVD